MPNSLSPQDQELYDEMVSWFDSLLYAANHTFILGQAGPRNLRRPMNRRELVELLRRRVTPIVQVPPSGSVNDRELYAEMLSLIRSLRTTTTGDFMQHNEATRKKVVDDFVFQTLHPMFAVLGCGDLCYDKERGCVEC